MAEMSRFPSSTRSRCRRGRERSHSQPSLARSRVGGTSSDLAVSERAGALTIMSCGTRLISVIAVCLATGCPDPGLEPKDSFACDFRVECVSNGSGTSCYCTAAANCHLDVTFETGEVCGDAALADHTRLRELVTAGCNLGSDTDFSRVP
jgi:hypothetical protein